jgi:DNA-binding response OmpR family regulator
MKPNAVLVLGSNDNQDLVDVLFDIGYTPIVRERMQGALDRLRHERFAAIIVDRDHVNVDVLEFTLNIRDFDEQTPVVVIGDSTDAQSDQVLLLQGQTFLLEKRDVPDRLVRTLALP